MMKILTIVESLTGNTMSFVEYIKENYGDKVSIHVITPKTPITDINWSEYDKVMLGCYTWDMGKIPKRTKKFTIENRDILLEQDLLIFGSGWTMYENFCGAVDGLSIILDNKFPTIKFELRFDSSLETEAITTLEKFIGEN